MSSRPTGSRGSRQSSRRASTKPGYAQRALRYAEEVCAGKLLACKWVKLACKRHLDDLAKSAAASYRWRFDERKANRFCDFFEGLPHVKDDFLGHAAKRETFKLEDWQCFIFCCIFGWVDKKKEFRRFTDALIMVPRKNGKTPMAAGVGTYCTVADGEYGAEIFAGASSKEQAGEVFQAARSMALASPELREAFGLWVNVASLVVQSTNSFFKMLKGQPADGPAPHCVLADEYHEYKTNRLIEWAKTGMTSRRQPLLFRITTAGTNTESPCYEMCQELQEVLEGRRSNDRLFGIIYTIDTVAYKFNGVEYKPVDWKSKKALLMANPNFGVSVNPDTVENDQQQARQSATKQVAFKTKNLNIWQNSAKPWVNMERWDECFDPAMKIDDFKDEGCIEAVDLASRSDTVSTVRLFRRMLPTGKDGEDEMHVFAFTRHYLNQEQVRDEKNPHFRDWAEKGFLIETGGNVTDYLMVNDDLAADANVSIVRELVFDPYHAAPLVQFLQARDDWPGTVEIVNLKQTEENMSAPMKELEAAINSKRFHHDGNPVLGWMVGNTRCRISSKDNWYPVRENVTRKIDGTVAIIIGMNRLMAMPQESYTSGEVRWI